MKKLITFTKKRYAAVLTMLTVLAVSSMSAMAEGVANTAVTGAFDQLKDDNIATLAIIGASAVGVMAIFLAWKYGRKLFNQVAK